MYIFSPPFICFFVLFQSFSYVVILFKVEIGQKKNEKSISVLFAFWFLFTLKKYYGGTIVQALEGNDSKVLQRMPWHCIAIEPQPK